VIWLRYLPHVIAAGALAATVYAVYTAGHDAGHGAGYQQGYTRGAQEAYRIADANALRLLSDARAAAEKTLREANESRQAEESRLAAEIAAARAQAAADREVLRTERDRLIARLRTSTARDPVRPAGSSSGLPETVNAGTGLTLPSGLLPEPDRESLIRIAYDADRLNVQYSICYRYARAITR
jgi:hypothetical protein